MLVIGNIRKSLLIATVKLFKAEIVHLRVYSNKIIIYCDSNLNGLYWAQNCPNHPRIRITAFRFTEGLLFL
jgi:hypothetical protein